MRKLLEAVSGYDEKTLIRPRDGMEVYGQNGYGWYIYADDADDPAFENLEKVPSKNPLFVYLKRPLSKSRTSTKLPRDPWKKREMEDVTTADFFGFIDR